MGAKLRHQIGYGPGWARSCPARCLHHQGWSPRQAAKERACIREDAPVTSLSQSGGTRPAQGAPKAVPAPPAHLPWAWPELPE